MMRHLALSLVLVFVFVFMPAAFGLPDEAAGRVVSVINGDSLGIEMIIADARTNNIDSIKLADIEAPSTVTAQGKAAKEYAFSLLKNKTVYLDINDNATGMRNEWSQLICVVYLMDSQLRPVWPPVNKLLVDAGHARLIDEKNNEFDPYAWWLQPPIFPPSNKSDLLKAILQGEPRPAQQDSPAVSPSSTGLIMGNPRGGSVLDKDSATGRVSIGYRT